MMLYSSLHFVMAVSAQWPVVSVKAARAFVESTGIPWEPMTDAQLAVQEAHEDLEVEKSADGVGNQTFVIQEAN